jgi:hypothetical protein
MESQHTNDPRPGLPSPPLIVSHSSSQQFSQQQLYSYLVRRCRTQLLPTLCLKAAATVARYASASRSQRTSSRCSNASQPHLASQRGAYSTPATLTSSPTPFAVSCSICTKKGYLHLYVPPSQFQLLTDATTLSTYTFNTGVAKHHFCSRCGVCPYYRPRSHPNDFDVNVRCLDDFHHVIDRVQITPFNGQSWEESVNSIQPPYLRDQQHPIPRNSHSTS